MITRTKILDFHQFACIIIYIFCLLILCVYFLDEITHPIILICGLLSHGPCFFNQPVIPVVLKPGCVAIGILELNQVIPVIIDILCVLVCGIRGFNQAVCAIILI